MSLPPLFMFGFERSGTTLLSMMTGAHPQLAVPLSVTGMWFDFYARLDDYDQLQSQTGLERLVDDVLAHERIGLWDCELLRAELLADLPLGSFGAVVAAFHAAYARAKGKPYWANMDIRGLVDMDQINRWFPDARFVHLLRDGRDVALSHQTMPYGASNIGECAQRWRERLSTNLKMGAMLGPERYLRLRYEDLVRSPEASLRELCRFAGLEYDAQMLRYPEMVEGKIPDDKRWLWPALDKAPKADNTERWRSRMSAAQRIVFEDEAGPLLRQLGYPTYEQLPMSWRARALGLWYWLTRGDRVGRLRRKLGVSTTSQLEKRWRRSRG